MVVFSKKTKELFYYKLVATGCQWERGHGREDMGERTWEGGFLIQVSILYNVTIYY